MTGLLTLAPPAASAGPTSVTRPEAGGYTASIRRTSYGVPHVKAASFADLGFGTGFVQAEDNICVIAEAIVTANGDRAENFGASDSNVQSDLFFRDVIASGAVERLLEGKSDGVEAPSPRARALVRGFVAGYNHFLATEQLTDPACEGTSWAGEITEIEYWRMLHASLIRAGSRAFLGGIVAAAPPGAVVPRTLRRGAADADDAAGRP